MRWAGVRRAVLCSCHVARVPFRHGPCGRGSPGGWERSLRKPWRGPGIGAPRCAGLCCRRAGPSPPSPATEKLAALRLEVEEIALTAASQRRKLEVVLGAVNRALQVEEPQAKWSVDGEQASAQAQRRGQGSPVPSAPRLGICPEAVQPPAQAGKGQGPGAAWAAGTKCP